MKKNTNNNTTMNILITNTHPESCFIDYMKALISGDHYQLMPKKIRVKELQIVRGKHLFPYPGNCSPTGIANKITNRV